MRRHIRRHIGRRRNISQGITRVMWHVLRSTCEWTAQKFNAGISQPDVAVAQDEEAVQAHRVFASRMQHVEKLLEQRNLSNSKMRGTCTLPYTWMLPSSEPGRTGRGVPYSTSI
jgi:hypothetical protein